MRPAFELHQPSAAGKEKGKGRQVLSGAIFMHSFPLRTLYEMKNYLQLCPSAHTHVPVRGMCQVTWRYIDLFLLTPRPAHAPARTEGEYQFRRISPRHLLSRLNELLALQITSSREKNGFIMSEIFSLLLRFFIYISAGCLDFCVPPEPRGGYEWDTKLKSRLSTLVTIKIN